MNAPPSVPSNRPSRVVGLSLHSLKFRSAREMFTKKQIPDESVDSYANRTRKLANRIYATDETLRYAFVIGLRPKIAFFVLSKEPNTINKALDAARVAEISLGKAQESENNELIEQLTKSVGI